MIICTHCFKNISAFNTVIPILRLCFGDIIINTINKVLYTKILLPTLSILVKQKKKVRELLNCPTTGLVKQNIIFMVRFWAIMEKNNPWKQREQGSNHLKFSVYSLRSVQLSSDFYFIK